MGIELTADNEKPSLYVADTFRWPTITLLFIFSYTYKEISAIMKV